MFSVSPKGVGWWSHKYGTLHTYCDCEQDVSGLLFVCCIHWNIIVVVFDGYVDCVDV